MTHGYHEGAPNYSPGQILNDNCEECAERGNNLGVAITSLDKQRFVKAWERAGKWQTEGLEDVGLTELPLLRALSAVQIQLERRLIRIGDCPGQDPDTPIATSLTVQPCTIDHAHRADECNGEHLSESDT